MLRHPVDPSLRATWGALSASQLRERPMPVAISVLCIALGVALAASIYWVDATAMSEFTAAARRLVGQADVIVRGSQGGFDEALYARIAKLSEVEAASPTLELNLTGNLRATPSLKLLGIDVLRAAQIQPTLIGELGSLTRRLLDDDAILLSAPAAQSFRKAAGDTLELPCAGQMCRFRVIGVLPIGTFSQNIALLDIATAQWRFGMLGQLNRIDLRLRAGADTASFTRRLSPQLPAGAVLMTPEFESERALNLTRAYRVNLNVLALVALFTGAFLIFSVQSLSLLRRRSAIALLRAVGATRGDILRTLLAEGLAIGTAGAGLGVVIGTGLAVIVIRLAQGDFGNGQIQFDASSIHITVPSILIMIALGAATSAAGAAIPAWEAARRAPALALKSGDAEAAMRPSAGVLPGIALLCIGAASSWLPAVHGVPLFGYLAIASLLFGAVLLLPSIAARVVWSLPRFARIEVDAAVAQLKGSVGLMAVALAPIVVSVALMVAMATMVHSFRQSFETWLDKLLPADIQLRLPQGAESTAWNETQQAQLRALPSVQDAQFRRSRSIYLQAGREPVTLIARNIDPAHPEAVLPLVAVIRADAATPLIWVSEAILDLYRVNIGDFFYVPLRGVNVRFTIAGVWRDYARSNGALVVSRADYQRWSGDAGANEASLRINPGADESAVEQSIRNALRDLPPADVLSTRALRERSLSIFDRAFAVTYALEILAIAIGLAGISVAASSTAISRRSEFGMLRHIGMLRSQVTRMLASEGLITSAIGVTYGVALGIALSLVLVFVINRQSFHWSIDWRLPGMQLGLLVFALIAAAALTAVWSGRAATQTDALRAVREDW